MALFNVVKVESTDGVIVQKFPSEDLTLGSQLIVYPGQVCFFLKGGTVCDEFREGRYTLTSYNIPLLNKLVNLPFGGDSPFQAQVWFFNTLSILDLNWGTETPILLEDPKYKVIVPVRAYGQYGFIIENPRLFLERIVGNQPVLFKADIARFFRGILLSRLTGIISKELIEEGKSFLEINSFLEEVSRHSQNELQKEFGDYGIKILAFKIISINIPEEDPSLIELKRAKSLQASLTINGRENYTLGRTLDVMETAAKNEGMGNMMGAGFALGSGLKTATEFFQGTGVSEKKDLFPPALPSQCYFLGIAGKKFGPFDLEQVKEKVISGGAPSSALIWRKGLKNWVSLEELPELQNLGPQEPPPLPTNGI